MRFFFFLSLFFLPFIIDISQPPAQVSPLGAVTGEFDEKGREGDGEGKCDTRHDADMTDRWNSMRWRSFIS